MPLDAAFAGIAANGITKLVDTNLGEKACHHVGNLTTRGEGDRYDREARNARSKDSSRSGRRGRSRSRHSEHTDEEVKPWSRKSYWKGSSRQQKSTSEPKQSFEDSEDEWSRKTYWRRSRHQQQPVPKVDNPAPTRRRSMTKEDRAAEQARMQRCDRFRNAKSSYVPAECRSADEMSWQADRLYADVGRAVREASRRSGEQVRG